MTNSHLSIEERESIQEFIKHEHTFTKIGKILKRDRTTIAKEIRTNRYVKSYLFEAFDPKGIKVAVENCPRLSKPPYVCNTCENKNRCRKHKLYYNSRFAQKHYEAVLVEARVGADITPEEIEEIEKIIVPLIKNKKHSVNQVFINHSDILNFSKSTFYKYVNDGLLSLINLDLPKKVKYKKRKKKDEEEKQYKRDIKILEGRRYENYLEFISINPEKNIVELDCVEGIQSDDKVLLTMIIKETRFMLMFLLDKQTSANVSDVFNQLKEKIGVELYKEVFSVILTDNGSEFYNPLAMEIDYDTGEKISNLFYCRPYSSWQKGTLESNHNFIRIVLPKSNEHQKGASFNQLDDYIVKRLENNINNIPRNILDGNTPYELTIKKYPKLIEILNCEHIAPDDVDMNSDSYLVNDQTDINVDDDKSSDK